MVKVELGGWSREIVQIVPIEIKSLTQSFTGKVLGNSMQIKRSSILIN